MNDTLDEKEIEFYETLKSFETYVKADGATFVLERLDPIVLAKLAEYFDS